MHEQHQSHVAMLADPGDDERAEHGAGAGKGHEARVERDVLLKDVFGDDRQEGQQRQPRNAEMKPRVVSVTSCG